MVLLTEVLSGLAFILALLAAPPPAQAQQPGRISRIGILLPGLPSSGIQAQRWLGALVEELRELGHVEGQSIVIDRRWDEGNAERLPALASELAALRPDIILTAGTPATRAAQQTTKTIPIVMITVLDPVGAGFVTNLARPAGNITGSSELSDELSAKRLELLREAVPKARRVAVLVDAAHPTNALDLNRIQLAARELGLVLHPIEIRLPGDFDPAFARIMKERADALIVLLSATTFVHRGRILDLVAKHRIATMYGWREGAEGGALMSYGVRFEDQFRRAAHYVDRILKGAKPADLPVEQPTRFDLVINLKTAKALGLTLPRSLLLRADHIIE